MAFNYSPKVVTDGLVLYVDAANPNSYVSGSTTWRDISRGGSIGTLTNGPTYSSANGGSIVFDGVDDYVLLPTSSILQPSQFTNNVWFNANVITSISDFQTLFGYSDGVGTNWRYGYSLAVYNNRVYSSIGNGGTSFTLNTPVITNTWYNATQVFNGTTQSLYLNGTLITTLASSLSYISALKPIIGYGGTGYVVYFKGNIANVSFYNRALSATEVRQNYNATKTRFGLT
jgi:hypothetical protein